MAPSSRTRYDTDSKHRDMVGPIRCHDELRGTVAYLPLQRLDQQDSQLWRVSLCLVFGNDVGVIQVQDSPDESFWERDTATFLVVVQQEGIHLTCEYASEVIKLEAVYPVVFHSTRLQSRMKRDVSRLTCATGSAVYLAIWSLYQPVAKGERSSERTAYSATRRGPAELIRGSHGG